MGIEVIVPWRPRMYADITLGNRRSLYKISSSSMKSVYFFCIYTHMCSTRESLIRFHSIMQPDMTSSISISFRT